MPFSGVCRRRRVNQHTDVRDTCLLRFPACARAVRTKTQDKPDLGNIFLAPCPLFTDYSHRISSPRKLLLIQQLPAVALRVALFIGIRTFEGDSAHLGVIRGWRGVI